MAIAEPTYADTSALVPRYLHRSASAAMTGWRARRRRALPITPHGRVEVVNAICLAAYLSTKISSPAATSAQLGCRWSDILHVATALELALPGS